MDSENRKERRLKKMSKLTRVLLIAACIFWGMAIIRADDPKQFSPWSAPTNLGAVINMRGQHEISSRIRGLLGQDFLSGFDYILNYRDQRIEFEEGGEFADTLEGTRIPVERNRKRVLITAESSSPHKLGPRMSMDSGTVRLVVFKGNSGNCDLDIELDETHVFNASTIVGSQTLSVGRLRRLQIGTQKFFDLPVLVASAGGVDKGRPENGILPTRLFRSVYFNNTQNFVILNPRLPTQVLRQALNRATRH